MYDQSQVEQIVEVPAEGDQISNTISAASPVTEQAQPQPEIAPVPNPTPPPLSEETQHMRNFKAMRQAAEQAQRERDDALRRAEQYERLLLEQTMASRTPAAEPAPEEDFTLSDSDDLVDNKKLNEYVRYQKKQIQELKKQQRAVLEQTKSATAEARFMTEHPDWQKVMSMDNIKALSDAYPELARSVNSASDVYEKAKATYTLIKRFGIYEETPYEAEKNRALENIAKPKPTASISPQQGDTPLSRANAFAGGLTKELKEQLRKEMAAASKRY